MSIAESVGVAVAFAAVGWLATTFATPRVMRLATWLGAVDRRGAHKLHRGAIPLMGGLAVAAPFLVLCAGLAIAAWLRGLLPQSVVASINLPTGMIGMVAAVRHEFAPLAIGGALIVIVGMVDDIYHLKPVVKLAFETLAAFVVIRSGYIVTEFGLPLLGTLQIPEGAGFLISLIWIVGLTNAFNMTDGVDGLATGIALIASLAFTVLAFIQGNLFVFLLGALLCGSLAAFLRFNFPPGKVFLGDTGSLFLGFSLATVALMGKHKGQATMLLGAPILILALPIIEMGVSVARRLLRGQPLFAGDARHTHHRLFQRGLSGRRTVLFLYAVCGLLAAAGITHAAAPPSILTGSICGILYGSACLAILWAGGYVRGPRTVLARLSRRAANRVLGALAAYGAQALSTNQGLEFAPSILSLFCQHAGLARIEVELTDGTVLHAEGDQFGDSPGTELRLDADMHNVGRAGVHIVFNRRVGDLEKQDVGAAVTRMLEDAAVRQPVDISLATRSHILGLGCNMLDYGTVLDVVQRWRQSPQEKSRYIIALNPHSVMVSKRNKAVLQSMAGAAMALPDGVGMIWAANILGYSHKGRCTGPTLMLNLCDWGRQHGFKHFFCGGEAGVADTLAARLKSAYPGLEVAGTYSPPFKELTAEEDAEMCRVINDSGADIVWVGLGAPKQERWMQAHEETLQVPVMVGVGAAFDYHSGRVKWAPTWVRSLGMEWLYRLIHEPRRLWRRNLDSPLFLLHVFLQKLKPPAFRVHASSESGPVAAHKEIAAGSGTTPQQGGDTASDQAQGAHEDIERKEHTG